MCVSMCVWLIKGRTEFIITADFFYLKNKQKKSNFEGVFVWSLDSLFQHHSTKDQP